MAVIGKPAQRGAAPRVPRSAGARATPAAWRVAPGPARLEIEVKRAPEAARYAPEAVWFEARPEGFDLLPVPEGAISYRPEFHEIEYIWDFGDPGDRFGAPQNLPDAYRDANSAVGQITAHVYRTGGRKLVTCTARRVIDPETMEIEEATATVTVDIGDPATLWTEANTVVVALDGDFAGAPPGARATSVASTDAAPWWSDPKHWLTQVNRLVADGERSIRVLFKHGEFYPTVLLKPNTRAPHIAKFVLFGAWGDRRRHKPTFPFIGQETAGWTNAQPFVFDGLGVSLDYDPISQTGRRDILVQWHEAGYALFTGMTIQRGGSGVHLQPGDLSRDDSPGTYIFHDCIFERIAAYGLYGSERTGDRAAFLGCREIDEGGAPHGSTDRFSGNAQGPMRFSGRADWVIASCDFFSRYGWTPQGNWPGTDIPATAEQPCIRVFGGGAGLGRVSVTRCSGEGGPFLSAAALVEGTPPQGSNLVIDQVIHVLSASTKAFMFIDLGAVTIRNGLWIKPEVDDAFNLVVAFYFRVEDRPGDDSPEARAMYLEPVRIHNNTIVSGTTGGLFHGPYGELDSFEFFEEANNVFYMPRSPEDVRHEDIAPFEAQKLWDLRWLGRLETADQGRLQYRFAPRDGAASLYWPLEGSPAIGDAFGLVSVFDLTGQLRSEPLTRGALEAK